LDATLASELDISTLPLSTPMDVRALDGRFIGWVTHNTTPINVRLSGNHSEAIYANEVSSGSCGIGIILAPVTQSPHRLDSWCHPGLEPILPRPLSEVSAACPMTSSCGLVKLPQTSQPFPHSTRTSGRFPVRPGLLHFLRTDPMTVGLTFSLCRVQRPGLWRPTS
jgi:hypothetical protein